MANKIIVAYDGTLHAKDALALGRSLSELTGASLAVAHVHRRGPQGRASSNVASGREAFLRRESEQLLAHALDSHDDHPVERYVLAGTTTASALRELAEAEGAELVVFGSAYHQRSGRVHPGSAARRLLHSAGFAIAIAPDGWRERGQLRLSTVAVAEDDEAESARDSAQHLTSLDDGRIVQWGEGEAQFLVVGSQRTSPAGKVMTSARSEQILRSSRVPAVVLPHKLALSFAKALAIAA
jgi:nucleotide-binding universal stress UspA family protein